MFIDQETLKRVNIYAPYKGFSRLDTPEIRSRAGVIEIPGPTPPEPDEGLSLDECFYVSDTPDDLPPYRIWTRKSDEQIKQAWNGKVQQQITSLERTALDTGLVRTLIEDLLDRALDRVGEHLGYAVPLSSEDKAAVNAILLDQNSPNYSRPYAKVFANADERALLRSQFR